MPLTIRVMRCNSCGLIYPEDLASRWGKEYGLGLGKRVCCEGLQSKYDRGCMTTKPNGTRIPPEEIMHPLHVCRGSLSVVDVSQKEYDDNLAIPARTDRNMSKRVVILRAKQEERSGVIKMLRTDPKIPA